MLGLLSGKWDGYWRGSRLLNLMRSINGVMSPPPRAVREQPPPTPGGSLSSWHVIVTMQDISKYILCLSSESADFCELVKKLGL
jgi:hypothetical protein